MTPLTDRQRIELMLPARLLRRCCISVEGGNLGAPVVEAFRLIEAEAVLDLPAERAAKLIRRVDRLQTELLLPFEESEVLAVTMGVLFWLRDMIAAGAIVLTEGSLADKATTELIARLSELSKLWDSRVKPAESINRRLRCALEQRGFYVTDLRMAV